MKKFALAILGLVLLSACEDDDNTGNGGSDGNGSGSSSPQAYVGIEGTSPNGISSLAAYNRTNQTIENNVFRKANINPMGSQLSDLLIDKDQNQIVLLLPGSNKIVFVDANSLVIKKQIKDLMQIRKIAKVSDFLYYVSSPELGGLYVVNALNGNIRSEIELDGITNPTEIKVWEDMAFISNTGDAMTKDSTVSVLRTSEDTLITSLIVGHAPNSMAIDEENNLWILCSGNFDAANPLLSGVGSLWKYNLDTMKMAIDSGYTIMPDTVKYLNDNQLRPHHLIYDDQGKNLYYISAEPSGPIVMSNRFVRPLSESPIVDDTYYSIAFDPLKSELYGMRTPSDIEENGYLEVFDPVGNKKVSIQIGVKPVDVIFK